jgi:hypothetical protein
MNTDVSARYRAVADRHRQLYWTAQSSRLLDASAQHVRLGISLLRSGAAVPETEVLGALAQSALLAGRIAFFDLQAPAEAVRFYRIGQDAALQAHDEAITSAILAHRAFVSAYAGRNARARALATAAQEAGLHGVSGLQQSWLHAVAGEIAARRGDTAAALASTGRARESLAAAADSDSDGAAAPAWLDFYDTARLAGFAGFAHLRAGEPAVAYSFLSESLDGLAAGSRKQRALLLADLAHATLAAGEVGRCVALLDEALAILAEHWYAAAMARVHAVRVALGPHASSREVREFDERLALYHPPAATAAAA